MSGELPAGAALALEEATLCHVVVLTEIGPHLTPMVFVLSDGRVWVTTSRSSVKAGSLRADPRVAGLVRAGDVAVCFSGSARIHDALDPDTWPEAIASTPATLRAAMRFTRKNLRFFAGYAVDARRLPLAWTPPGRVFAELEPSAGILVEGNEIASTWGRLGARAGSRERFQVSRRRASPDPLASVPDDVAGSLPRTGDAVLALETSRGPLALPVRWSVHEGEIVAALPAALLRRAGADPTPSAALEVDVESAWRARSMRGVMFRGIGEIHVVARLASGRRSAERAVAATGADPAGAALVRLRPDRVTWWRGWSSGTVRPG